MILLSRTSPSVRANLPSVGPRDRALLSFVCTHNMLGKASKERIVVASQPSGEDEGEIIVVVGERLPKPRRNPGLLSILAALEVCTTTLSW